jgi:serine phosphatase RsbU (regulator of sigma subunit)
VGGDFYDFFELESGEVAVVIGDVTDKGVPAAMVMAAARSVLRASGTRIVSPGDVLRRVNDLLVPDIPERMFVTCLYAVVDPATGRIRFANAGHNLPLARTADGSVELRATGMPLGLLPGMEYEEVEAVLAPGETLLLYSDGITEAHDPEREMFGTERLAERVAGGGAELIDGVLTSLRRFTGEAWEQEDDITIVTLRRTGVPAGEPGRDPRALPDRQHAGQRA